MPILGLRHDINLLENVRDVNEGHGTHYGLTELSAVSGECVVVSQSILRVPHI